MSNNALLVLACLFALAMWVNIAVTIKRFHDRGKPGVWFLMMFVPYIGSIWILVECGFLRGASGWNDYDAQDDGLSDFGVGRMDRYRSPVNRATSETPMITDRPLSLRAAPPVRRALANAVGR